MTCRNMIIWTAATSLWLGSLASAQEIEARFSELRAGDRCSMISTAMGAPTSMSSSSTLGVVHSRVRWVTGARTYVITCVLDRLVSKRVCQSMSDC